MLRRRVFAAIGGFERLVIGLGMAAAATLIFLQVVLRYGFSIGIPWAEEVTVYATVWVTFTAASAAVGSNNHLTLDVRELVLAGRGLRWVERLASLIGLAYGVILAVVGVQLAWHAHRFGQFSSALQLPIWIVYLVIPLSGMLMALRFADHLFDGGAPACGEDTPGIPGR